MNWDRVFAVTGAGGAGSGYLVAPDLVLTSGHVAGTKAVSALMKFRRSEGFSLT